jgi:DNA (cytosine-5)-methyltransferase 1
VSRRPNKPEGRATRVPDSAAGKKSGTRVTRPSELREDAPPYYTGAPSIARQEDVLRAEQCSALQPLRFIDLFCGIGGFRIAFERAGCECVFSSDWNEMAQTTYEANFHERPHGDIYSVPDNAIPPHNILCAGFPCQPFSIAGVSKKLSLGRKHGFEDKEQGNLFFKLAELIDHHRPDAFVLENVKHLVRHDKGQTFRIIHETLTEHLKYHVYHQVIDARSVVPQHRERIKLDRLRDNSVELISA